MAWTAPITWEDAVVYDEGDFNEQIRDNMLLLKTPFTDAGKVVALDGARLADLSGLNLTGLVKYAQANTITVGVQRFQGTTVRLVLPVGADKYDGAPGNKTAGSLWVEGDNLHWVNNGQIEMAYAGVLVSTPAGAVSGSFWIETNGPHYVDASGKERRIAGSAAGKHADAAAQPSIWMEDYLGWVVTGGQEYKGAIDLHTDTEAYSDHTNTAHDNVDGHDDSSHSNTAHANTPYDDTWANYDDDVTPHHNATGHDNAAYDDGVTHDDTSHTNTAHADTPEVNEHDDHGAYDDHVDQPTVIGP